MWMNRLDVEEALILALRHKDEQPNRFEAAFTLARLVNLTDRVSDGWPYWSKPSRAARQLMGLLQDGDRWSPEEVDGAALRRAYSPIRAMLTREGLPHEEVFG